jgi:hypothetical protein
VFDIGGGISKRLSSRIFYQLIFILTMAEEN